MNSGSGGITQPEHEMRGEIRTVKLQAQPLGHAAVENRQADRNPLLAVHHLIEIAVSGVEIVVLVPLVTLFDEERPVDLS